MTKAVDFPDQQCAANRSDGEQCEAFAMPPSDKCRVHGGTNPNSVLTRHLQVIAASEAQVVDAPPRRLTLTDLAESVTAQADWMATLANELRDELDGLRLVGSAIELTREYGDVVGMVDRLATTQARLMTSVAAVAAAAASVQRFDLASHPAFGPLVASIMSALEPYPEARIAVAEALTSAY